MGKGVGARLYIKLSPYIATTRCKSVNQASNKNIRLMNYTLCEKEDLLRISTKKYLKLS